MDDYMDTYETEYDISMLCNVYLKPEIILRYKYIFVVLNCDNSLILLCKEII